MATSFSNFFQRARATIFIRNEADDDDDEELLGHHPHEQQQQQPSSRPTPHYCTINPTWTRPLIFQNLAIVLGTSFINGFYTMAIARPLAIYPSSNEFSSRKINSLPIVTLFFHHLLTFYASRLFAFVGPAHFFGNRFGRRKTLLSCSVLGFIAVLIGLASPLMPTDNWQNALWAISASLIGFQTGMGQVIAPAFLIEIAPLAKRGACGFFYEAFFWIGMALAFISEVDLNNETAVWTFILAICATVYILHFGMLLFGIESPHWLIHEVKQDNEAHYTIAYLRQCSDEAAVREMNEIKATEIPGELANFEEPGCCCCPQNPRFRHRCNLCRPKTIWPTFIGCCLMSANLLTGAPIIYKIHTALINKSDFIGILKPDDYHFPVVIAIFLVLLYLGIMTLAGLFFVDSLGRRGLVLCGLGGMVIAYIPIMHGVYFKDATAWQFGSLFFMVAYSLGPGPIAPFMTAELFEYGTRLSATSLCLLITHIFPVYMMENYEADKIYEHFFMPGGILFSVLELIMLWLYLPETKRLTFDRIVSKFQPGKQWLQIFKRPSTPRVLPSLTWSASPHFPEIAIQMQPAAGGPLPSCNLDEDADINAL